MSDLDPAVGVRRVLRRANRQFDAAIAALADPPPPTLPIPKTQMEAYGQGMRALHEAFKDLAQQFSRGWTAIDRLAEATRQRPGDR